MTRILRKVDACSMFVQRILSIALITLPLTLSAQFVTTWQTDLPGETTSTQIEIPTFGGSVYDYNILWTEVGNPTHTGTLLNQTGNAIIEFGTAGTYRVEITGLFPQIYFNAGDFAFGDDNDSEKILSVEQWGINPWTSMRRAFSGCLNLRINASDAPDLSGVTDMSQMFFRASSLNNLNSNWDVSTITNMGALFREAQVFNQDIGSWNVDMVTSMTSMFEGAASFNQNLNGWNVDAVTGMSSMFRSATAFNGDISNWHVENLTSFRFMFLGAQAFNQDISGWQINTSSNVSLEGMFAGATSFNQDISFKPGGGNNGGDAWNTSMVTSMRSTFSGTTALTQSIVNWDVANVTTMQSMFSGNTTFNQDISGWPVDNVRDMEDMFSGASSFNQDISSWNVGMVDNMRGMFLDATSFNQDIGGWDVSGVSEMRLMFQNASSFDQNLGGWDFSSLFGTGLLNFLNNSGLSVTNYDNLLIGLQAQIGTLNPSVSNFGAQNIYYCAGESARAALAAFGWIFNDGGLRCIALFDGTDTTAPEIANSPPQAIDFGSINAGVTKTRSFTIENFQSVLIADVATAISSGTGTAFTTSPAPVTIASGGTHTFTIDLLSAAPGAFAETVTITSSSFGGSFQFPITGEVTATPEPEISVFEGSTGSGTPILDGQPAAFDLGIQTRGFSITRDISINNVGSDVLNISDISFPAGSEFQLVSIPPSSIPVDGTEIIQILITGSNAGLFIEQLTISSDDTDESAFSFTVLAEIIGPDIWVVDGLDIFSDPEIMNGQVTPVDLGSGTFGSDIVRQLILTSATNADLFVSNISISGSAFTFTPLAPFTVTGETDGVYDEIVFEITLSGATGGTFNETVTILNDDNADPIFTFPITGTIVGTGCGTLPTVDAGADATVCASTVMLAGAVGGGATGATWTPGSGATGTFDDQTILTPTYTPSAGDITAGSITLLLTVAANGSCPEVEDEMTLTFPSPITAGAPSVQGNVGQSTLIDVVNSSGTTAGNVSTVTVTQNPSQGSASVNSDNTISYVSNSGTVGADSFEYEICNNCSLCSIATVSVDILNTPPIFTAPTIRPEAAPGQSIVLSIPALVSDLNDNLDLNSFSNFNSTANASSSYDPNTGDLTLDYSNSIFSSAQDNISFTICDLLNSCTDISVQIDLNGEITVFNGISPNGDGDNDFFTIQNIQFVEPENKVFIYNRWGDLIFDVDNYDSENPDRRFNGISNKGKEVTSGVYFYKVEFVSGRESLDGYLTIKK